MHSPDRNDGLVRSLSTKYYAVNGELHFQLCLLLDNDRFVHQNFKDYQQYKSVYNNYVVAMNENVPVALP